MPRPPKIEPDFFNQLVKKREWETDTNQLVGLVRYVSSSANETARHLGVKRNTVYSWSANRCKPTVEQERKLNTIAALVTLVYEQCGVSVDESSTYLRSFSFDQTGTDDKSRLEKLVDDDNTSHVFEETVQYFIEKNSVSSQNGSVS